MSEGEIAKMKTSIQSEEMLHPREQVRPWSDLPQELLSSIGSKLVTPQDISCFRAVSPSWRNSLPPAPTPYILSPHLPYTFPSLAKLHFPERHKSDSLELVATGVFLVQPLDPAKKPWVLTVEEFTRGKVRVFYPLSTAPVAGLPRNFAGSVSFLGCNVTEICKGYNFKSRISSAYKVVVFSDNPAVDDINCCTIVVLYEGGMLGSWRLRGRMWMSFSNYGEVRFDDIAVFNGMVCAVDRVGRLYAINYKAKVSKTIVDVPIPEAPADDFRKRLVESSGDIYLVHRLDASDRTVRFRVFKLNTKGPCNWSEVKNLGDQVLFVGSDSCFFVSNGKIPGCHGNCIVFKKSSFDRFRPCDGDDSVDSYLFLGAKKELEIGVFHLKDCDNFGFVSSDVAISDLLWPSSIWSCSPASLPSGNSDEELNVCSKNAVVEDIEHTKAGVCRTNKPNIAGD